MKMIEVVALASVLAAGQGALQLKASKALTPEQAEILSHMSIVELPDGLGGTTKTIRVEGVNVQIINGAGSTETSNGLGNLIVGYQETGNTIEADERTGSHYLIVGRRNNYTSFGGIVVGESHVAEGLYASISAGTRNRAIGNWSSVGGGGHNHAAGQGAAVVGGDFNFASGDSSVVVGGSGNRAESPGGGGTSNKAVVVGGFDNTVRGQGAVIVGGRYNDTTANYSAVLAGTNNTCQGDPQGGGSYCAIVGGEGNLTTNVTAATVGGGLNRSATGAHDWAAGNLYEDE